MRLGKARKKKKPGVKSDRVLRKQEPVHRGPRYHISFREARIVYGRMRKGRGFYPSNKVLWKNRHALVLGCSNFYRKGKDNDTSNFKEDNIEYDIVEPPEPSPDPQVPTTGAEFSSDYTANGPDQRNALGGRKKYKNKDKSKNGSDKIERFMPIPNLQMSRSSHGRGGHTQQEQTTLSQINFSKILEDTAHRRKRGQLQSNNSSKNEHSYYQMKGTFSGARGNDFLDSSGLTTDTVLWEYICKVDNNLADTALLNIFSDFDGRVRTLQLNRSRNNLEQLIDEGTNDPMVLKLWKIQLEAKKKEIVEHQGVVPGTPESSDDEDAEGNDHESTFCALEPQKNYCMVSPNERTDQNFYDPPPQQMVTQKLITNAIPYEKSRSSEGRGVRTQQEQMNYPILRKKDKQITRTQQIVRRTVQFNDKSSLEHTRRIKQNYMEN